MSSHQLWKIKLAKISSSSVQLWVGPTFVSNNIKGTMLLVQLHQDGTSVLSVVRPALNFTGAANCLLQLPGNTGNRLQKA